MPPYGAFPQGLHCLPKQYPKCKGLNDIYDKKSMNTQKTGAPVFKGTRPYHLNVTVVIAILQLVQYPNKSAKKGHPTQEVN